MNADAAGTEAQGAHAAEDPAIMADLRLRLQGSLKQEAATRAEARQLARELALTRRLLRFAASQAVPLPTRPPEAGATGLGQRAVRLTTEGRFHLEAYDRQDTQTVISGWAFRPVPAWDARRGSVTLLLRHGATVYAAAAGRVPRPDVAAHFAAQPAEESGGASGLEAAGFACGILHDSLPAGVDWEVVLRLEGPGPGCDLPTGRRLRLPTRRRRWF